MTTEHNRARAWRERHGMTRDQLAQLVGYAPLSIYWFERGETPPRNYANSYKRDRKIDLAIWRRYKMACAGADAQIARKRGFDW